MADFWRIWNFTGSVCIGGLVGLTLYDVFRVPGWLVVLLLMTSTIVAILNPATRPAQSEEA